MTDTPSFPPLMAGEAVTDEPFGRAIQRAADGCDAGLILHRLGDATMEAALIFAPEVALRDAVAMLPLCAVGLQNAIGALSPPEVAVHLEWDGGLRLNGASCGRLRIAAATAQPDAVPDWLVVGFSLPLYPPHDPDMAHTGDTPDETALYAEGCAEIAPPALLESCARHCLHWINRWETDGPAGLHAEWRGLLHGLNTEITQNGQRGQFVGVDEHFGMLLRDDKTTHLIPLTTLLEPAP